MDEQKSDDIKSILTDIQNKKINSNVGAIDNFLFLFAKIFNSNNKKQLYLQRLEKVLQEELSIDYLFQEFKLIKLSLYRDLKKHDNIPNFVTDGTPFRLSINNISSINNI